MAIPDRRTFIVDNGGGGPGRRRDRETWFVVSSAGPLAMEEMLSLLRTAEQRRSYPRDPVYGWHLVAWMHGEPHWYGKVAVTMHEFVGQFRAWLDAPEQSKILALLAREAGLTVN